jgi:hypothetical protein
MISRLSIVLFSNLLNGISDLLLFFFFSQYTVRVRPLQPYYCRRTVIVVIRSPLSALETMTSGISLFFLCSRLPLDRLIPATDTMDDEKTNRYITTVVLVTYTPLTIGRYNCYYLLYCARA